MQLVQEMERRFLPILNDMSKHLAREFPEVRTRVLSSAVGSLTDYQGQNLGVECLFPNATPDQDDNVALIISVKHLTTQPLIDSVDVCWGLGYVEDTLFPNPMEATESALAQIEANLPRLYETLKMAVRRGHPSNEN